MRNFSQNQFMQKTFFLSIIAIHASLLIGCGQKSTQQEASSDSVKVEITDTANNFKGEESGGVKTEVMTLISGNSNEDAGKVVFKDEKGHERLAWTVPDNVVEWDESDIGSNINDHFLNKKYTITYEMKKEFSEPAQLWETRMVISAMDPVE